MFKNSRTVHADGAGRSVYPALEPLAAVRFYRGFADIGDEQSIEQSFWTPLSPPMTSIVSIPGRQTQIPPACSTRGQPGPTSTEGAALAIAILNYPHDRGIRTMATTHYKELKIYALSTKFVGKRPRL